MVSSCRGACCLDTLCWGRVGGLLVLVVLVAFVFVFGNLVLVRLLLLLLAARLLAVGRGGFAVLDGRVGSRGRLLLLFGRGFVFVRGLAGRHVTGGMPTPRKLETSGVPMAEIMDDVAR